LRIEQSRKHGRFDPRYPPAHFKPVPASLWQLGEERLDWQGFLARFFPASRRHDSDALAAYESYLNDIDGCPVHGFPPPALAGSSSAVHGAAPDRTRRKAARTRKSRPQRTTPTAGKMRAAPQQDVPGERER